MDPDQLEELRKALTAHRRGVSLSRVDSIVNERTDFDSLRSFVQHARDQGVPREELERDLPPPRSAAPQEQEGGGSLLERIGRPNLRTAGAVGQLATQGITLGFADELGGLLAGAGAALVPGGEGFSEARERTSREIRGDVDQAREDLGPVLSTAAEIGGAVAAPGAGAFRLASKVPGLFGRSVATGALGAAEGAAYGAGSAEPGERLEGARRDALAGGLLGAAIPGGIAAAGAAAKAGKAGARAVRDLPKAPADALGLTRIGRDTRKAEALTGPQTADEFRRLSDVEGSPAAVRADIEARREGLYGELDEIEEIDHPGLRSALQDETVAPHLPEEVASGARAPSFPEAQGSIRMMRKQARAALRSGDAASFRELTNAQRKVGRELIEAVPDVEDANKAFATEMRRIEALEAGDDFMKGEKTADAFEEAWEDLDSDAARQAFREAAGTRFMEGLEDITAIKSTLEKIQHGRPTRRKLKILLGGQDKLDEFADVARQQERIRNRAKQARTMRRFILPLIGAGGAGGALF